MPTDYENAVEAFQLADATYKELEEYISSGKAVEDIAKGNYGPDMAREQWHIIWGRVRAALEDRNARMKSAKDALRAAVQLSQTQWRGPDGGPSLIAVGEFKATSVTSRSFNATSLFALLNQHGKLQEFLAVTKVDKDGHVVPAAKQEWKFEFDTVLNWLKAHNLTDVINGAYEEAEKTPQVKGLKALTFLGEKKDD